MTIVPERAIDAGILDGTEVVARPLQADHPGRTIALVWRKGSPRDKEFRLLADALREGAKSSAPKRRVPVEAAA